MKNDKKIEDICKDISAILKELLSEFYEATFVSYSTNKNGFYFNFDTEARISEKDLESIGEKIKIKIKEKDASIDADAFRLVSISGVYQGDDEKNKMIQRIYAVVFESKEE